MAQLLDGKAVARAIKEEIARETAAWREKGITPKLAVVLVGDDPASLIYAKSKEKVGMSLGIEVQLLTLPGNAPEQDVLELIERLNRDDQVHGIMIELPLPGQLHKERVVAALRPDKDVDGMHPVNRGYSMNGEGGLFPATPQSCIELLKGCGIEIAGKHVVIVGRGETVGKPLVFLILKHNATVTICHSRTQDLSSFTSQADILVAAVGKANLITRDMVKPGAVVVDAGINETETGICGDVDFAGVSEVAGWISPVPGGVGALTTALLMANVLKGMALQRREDR